MVFGTFDILHEGHLNFFKQAREHGDYLMVVVARDVNTKKIKGELPLHSEDERLQAVGRVDMVDQVLLGHPDDPYYLIRQEKPDVIALGYDQESYDQPLYRLFPNIKIVRLKAYKPEIFKSSKLKNTQ